jgi:hypothetical protein
MGKVSEFRDQLFQSSPAQFAQWRKIDLHNSSKAVEMTAQKILEADLSVVMFTDHEKLPELAFVKELAAKTKRLIIRGVELNVFVDIWDKPEGKVGKNLFFHLLVGFDPDGQHPPDYWLTDIYKRCKAEKRMCGNAEITGVAASSYQRICILLMMLLRAEVLMICSKMRSF